jgi:hypothetical protein
MTTALRVHHADGPHATCGKWGVQQWSPNWEDVTCGHCLLRRPGREKKTYNKQERNWSPADECKFVDGIGTFCSGSGHHPYEWWLQQYIDTNHTRKREPHIKMALAHARKKLLRMGIPQLLRTGKQLKEG